MSCGVNTCGPFSPDSCTCLLPRQQSFALISTSLWIILASLRRAPSAESFLLCPSQCITLYSSPDSCAIRTGFPFSFASRLFTSAANCGKRKRIPGSSSSLSARQALYGQGPWTHLLNSSTRPSIGNRIGTFPPLPFAQIHPKPRFPVASWLVKAVGSQDRFSTYV